MTSKARIGVLSIFDMDNVGNRLQNYALVEALRQGGHAPVVLENYPYHPGAEREHGSGPEEVSSTRAARVRDAIRFRLWRDVPPSVRVLPKVLRARLRGDDAAAQAAAARAERTRALTRFTRGRMVVSDGIYRRPEDLIGLGDQFDAFVVGSDQVWNPHYRRGCPMDLLYFASPHKRIAYAASIGADSFGDAEPVFRRLLPEMAAVSVRETAAADLVEQTCGRRPPVMPDPTLLHDADFWRRLSDDAPPRSVRPYVATYLLYRNGSDVVDAVQSRAAAEGLDRHDILHPSGPRAARHAGAEAFLRAIRDAEYVVTDSFHATLFSILFRVPVVVLPRDGGQNARIDTLLALFGLTSADLPHDAHLRPSEPLVDDPETVLGPVRNRARAWLTSALDTALGHC